MSAATDKLRDEIAEACSNDCRESVRQLMYPAATMRSDIAAALDRYAAAIRAEERERAAGLREALMHATAALMGAASAYEKYACRAGKIRPRAVQDPFFTTRCRDIQRAADAGAAALAAYDADAPGGAK